VPITSSAIIIFIKYNFITIYIAANIGN